MKKLPALLIFILILTSCEMVPDLGYSYSAGMPKPETKDKGQPESGKSDNDSAPRKEPEDNLRPPARPESPETPGLAEPSAESGLGKAGTELQKPAEIPPPVQEFAEADYPVLPPDSTYPSDIPAEEPVVQLPPEQVPPSEMPAEPPVVSSEPSGTPAQVPASQPAEPPAQSPAARPAEPPAPAPASKPAEPPVPASRPAEPPAQPPSLPAPDTSPPAAEEPARDERAPPIAVPDMPFQPVPVIPAPGENDLSYSRTVRALAGQYIEIPFRGPGWVYLGEFGSRRGVRYDSRQMDEEGMTFIFRAEAEGTYSLKFNRQDFIRDIILNDFVKVIVEQPPAVTGSSWSNSQAGPGRVYALPRWPLAAEPQPGTSQPGTAQPGAAQSSTASQSTTPPGAAQSSTASQNTTQPGTTQPGAAQSGAVPQGAAQNTQPVTSAVPGALQEPAINDWLRKAREEYNAGRYKNALDALDQFMILFPSGSDEAYWLYGQSLEANNEATRDIRLSLDYYRRLIRDYPQSSRYNEARQRIAYLERFYFNIH